MKCCVSLSDRVVQHSTARHSTKHKKAGQDKKKLGINHLVTFYDFSFTHVMNSYSKLNKKYKESESKPD